MPRGWIRRASSGMAPVITTTGGLKTVRTIAIIAASLASAVVAQEPPAAAPPPQVVKDIDKVKCRKEMPIGSMVPKRVCTTERIENLNRDEARATFVRPQHMNPQ